MAAKSIVQAAVGKGAQAVLGWVVGLDTMRGRRIAGMHEVALVSAALERAVRAAHEAGAHRIERITFAVASDGHISADAVVMLVAALGRGSLAEGAHVQVIVDDTAAGSAQLALTSIDVEVPAAPGVGDSGA